MGHDEPFAGKTIHADWAYYLDTSGTYTPTLTGGTNPALGDDGFINGKWHRSGHLITAWGDTLLDGTGADLGGSSWRISLPFDADASFHSTGFLNGSSDQLGSAKFRSGGVDAEAYNTVVLLSGAAELIFYNDLSDGSVGGANLTLPVRLKWTVHYVADPAGLPT